jgi:hypothetical protein
MSPDVNPLASPPSRELPRGHHKLPPEVVRASQRSRLLNAMLDFVAERGYGATTVPAVVARALLDRAQQQFAVQTRLLPLYGPVYLERSVLAKMAHITVPVYVFSGWEDMYSR